MTDTQKSPQEFYQEHLEENQQLVDEVIESPKKDFPDEAQHEAISDIFTQVFTLTNQVEELSRHYMFISSYIDSFYTHLVGESKLISEDQFRETAQAAYKASVDAVTQAMNEIDP